MGVAQAADSKLDSVLQRGKLIVGTGSTNAPWHFQGADGKLQGFDIDIARMVAKGLFNDPEKVEFVVQSSDARIPNLLTDKVDMSCQFITVTASRAQQVAFTLPYYREGVGLLLPANSKYKEIEDLKAGGDGVTVAVLQNVYAEELVHQALPKAKVDQYDSVDLMYQAVNSGRADAAATDQSSVKYLMVQNPGRYRSPAYAWSPQTYACAVKRGDQDWLNFVNTTLHEAMTGVEFPTYAASFKQWFGVELPSPAIGFPVEFK
ncbi:polar amino acid transport system substrate-binding protein [Pseudomonas fluorescens]|nr:polar amino acid transport system substrate-binding protein [Pseudomonas fluorescens]